MSDYTPSSIEYGGMPDDFTDSMSGSTAQEYAGNYPVTSIEDTAPVTKNTKENLVSTIAPEVGLGLDIIGVIGGGIQAYQKAKEDEKIRQQNQRNFEAQMAQKKEEFEFNRDMDLKKYGLTLDQWKENKSRYGTDMKNYYDQRNYDRMNEYTKNLSSLANKTGNRMLQLYGRGGQ
jgi:hypothetical protein